jgi:hypothetical protein
MALEASRSVPVRFPLLTPTPLSTEMPQIYSTEELLNILAQERKACINGHRLNLAATPSGINPLIDRFVSADGIQRFTAYNDFRSTIHHYQREHQISGIVWQQVIVHGKQFRYPKVDEQLISLPPDLRLMQSMCSQVVQFWQEVTQGMDFFLSLNGGKLYHPVQLADIERILQRSQWASLSQQGKADTLEVILQLGWGHPEQAVYRRGFPESGSEYIHATQPGQLPIG